MRTEPRAPGRWPRAWALLAVLLLVAAAAACVAVLTLRSPTGDAARPSASRRPGTSETQARVHVHRDGGSLRVLFAGDSLTYGSYASTRDRTYRALVMRGLRREAEATTRSVGGPGQTSAVVARSVRSERYDLVVVETGTNDASKERPELVAEKYRALLTKVRRASPDAGLVCIGSWLGQPAAERVDDVIRSGCDTAGGLFVPVSDLYRDKANRGPAGRQSEFGTTDAFHPNDAGHRAIAGRVLDAVRIDKTG